MIVSALTFHGGTNVIGYPWGSYNHATARGVFYSSNEAPDFKAFAAMGEAMKDRTGRQITVHGGVEGSPSQTIEEYVMGDISSTIYPVNGGLEDWAYGAGWDFDGSEASILQCRP